MEKAGESESIIAARRCDELGVDPSWPLAERVSRMIDIEHGSGRMSEEVVRGADYVRNNKVSNELFDLFSKKPKLNTEPETADVLRKTYLNDHWLKQQELVSKEITLGESDYGTYLGTNPPADFNKMKSDYKQYVDKQLAKITTYENQLASIKSTITSDPDGDHSSLVSKANSIKLEQLVPFEWPNKDIKLKTLDATGLKTAANLAVAILNENTRYPSILHAIGQRYNSWKKVRNGSKENDSDTDIIARNVMGHYEDFTGDVYSDDVGEAWSLNKANFLRCLFELMNKSIK